MFGWKRTVYKPMVRVGKELPPSDDMQIFAEYLEKKGDYSDEEKAKIEKWNKGRKIKHDLKPDKPNSIQIEEAIEMGIVTKDEEVAFNVDRLRKNTKILPVKNLGVITAEAQMGTPIITPIPFD